MENPRNKQSIHLKFRPFLKSVLKSPTGSGRAWTTPSPSEALPRARPSRYAPQAAWATRWWSERGRGHAAVTLVAACCYTCSVLSLGIAVNLSLRLICRLNVTIRVYTCTNVGKGVVYGGAGTTCGCGQRGVGAWKASSADKGTYRTSNMSPMIIASWGYCNNISFFMLIFIDLEKLIIMLAFQTAQCLGEFKLMKYIFYHRRNIGKKHLKLSSPVKSCSSFKKKEKKSLLILSITSVGRPSL